MKYRKIPIVIEAHQWFYNGDHPEDDCLRPFEGKIPTEPREGKIVRYFRHPTLSDEIWCPDCGIRLFEHGFIDTKEGGHRVCPGDWIITGIAGEYYPCKDFILKKTYEKV